MKFRWRLAALIAVAAMGTPSAHAQYDPAYASSSDIMLVDTGYSAFEQQSIDPPSSTIASEGLITEEQIEDVVRRFLAENKAPQPVKEPAPKKTFPDMRMTGFFQLDTARFGQSANSMTQLGDIQDGTGFRRARLAATGNITEKTSYMFEFDIAQAQARFVDVWGQFNETPFGNVRIGRFRQPFGMSELTSVRELPFIERPSTFALAPFRQTGIMFFDTALDQQMTWAASGFRTLSDNFGNMYGDNGGYGTAERITMLPIDGGEDFLVHLGADHSYLQPGRDLLQYASQDQIFIGQQPDFGPTGLSVQPLVGVPPFVNSGTIGVNNVNLFNLEAAASVGRALVQSEIRWSRLNLLDGGTATVPAAYLTGRYMLTGEIIPYNRTGGVFGRVIPNCPVDLCKGHIGAWELLSQASYLDLNPLAGTPTRIPGTSNGAPLSTLTATPSVGGRMANYTLGMNWYLNAHSKIATNYIYTDLNRVGLNSATNTFAGMVQFDF